MNRPVMWWPLLLFTGFLTAAFLIKTPQAGHKKNKERDTMAGHMDYWYASRTFPSFTLPVEKYYSAWQAHLATMHNQVSRSAEPGPWTSLGPLNIGGRTLCIAFNPLNPYTIYAGSASGGLWRSYSAGEGVAAWQHIVTGFPVLGVGAIAISPVDSNTIFIGTGEMYNYQSAGTGFVERLQRGSYGIGILKTSDGGATWTQSLNWTMGDMRGIQDIVINPLNPNSVWAATTEGLYHSADNGLTWNCADSNKMVTDIEIPQGDTSRLFFACGYSEFGQEGIYRSVNGGASFQQLTVGLPDTFTGKALIGISPSDPQIIYASIAEAESGLGLFKSTDGGDTWTNINAMDFQSDQGWYSHDVIVHPTSPDTVYCAGVYPYMSTDGGLTLNEIDDPYVGWYSYYPVGGPEGPPQYIHSDFHRLYFFPSMPDTLYFATDGGIFRTTDGGMTFEGLNGGYQTSQFYSRFSNSSSDSLFSIGGMQDNGSGLYFGDPAWTRVIGGDGTCTAIDPTNDNTVFGSWQWMELNESTDRGNTFNPIAQGQVPTGQLGTLNIAFNAPYALSQSDPQVMYAGTWSMYQSLDEGADWFPVGPDTLDNNNPILHISISPTGPDTVYATVAPVFTDTPRIFKSMDGGETWMDITGNLPNRYYMQIGIKPGHENEVFVVVSGFGTDHIYKSTNGGQTWQPSGTGLPDLPTNAIFIDPYYPDTLYVGNDLGVYVSTNDGASWQAFSDSLPEAVIAMDLSMSASNHHLRVATHGTGVYDRNLLGAKPVQAGILGVDNKTSISVFPDPASGEVFIRGLSPSGSNQAAIYDMQGKLVAKQIIPAGDVLNVQNLAAGVYLLHVTSSSQSLTARFVKL